MGDESYPECRAQELFDEFVSSSTCRAALGSFSQLCEHLQLDRSGGGGERPLYRAIKHRLNYWRANALWAKLDRRAAQQEYQKARVCNNITCVIIGAGPCGLRAAVELSFMGARVVLLEKRDSFSRNNVLHLWPYTIHDLRGLGAKKFYGKFCAGSIDHISIRQLQLVLLKVALLLGVEVHVNVEFKNLVEPPEDQQRHKVGWRMAVKPKSHPVNQLEFDVIIGADGRRNTLPGFRRKEFRGKLAIAITANFKNRNTTAEAKVEEISGVASIFNQRFFQELRQETGIDLENIVYYKDDTHYFVMTAKKQSLLEKGVIIQDFADTALLLSRGNVDQNALQMYAREAADFSTNHQLPSLDFAMNHYGQPDVAMFDFTCMYASENAALVRQRRGHQLLVTLVGDSLLEPFWPMGTGIARGFLAALDSCWMVLSWSQGGAPLDVLAQRESVYRLLPQTTPENLQKNFSLFTVDPTTRYLNINRLLVTPAQVRHLVDTGEEAGLNTDCGDIKRLPSHRFLRQDSFSQSNKLLSWCQEQTRGYRGVAVSDLTTSWKSGLALCALIHRYRPDLIDFDSLDEASVEENTRLGFDVAEREFGISPLMTVDELSSVGEPDSLSMVMYLTQFYQLLKDTPPPAGCLTQSSDLRSALITPASLLSRLGLSPSRKRNPKEQKDARGKRRKTSRACGEQQELWDLNGDVDGQLCDEAFVGGTSRSRVRLMANQLQAKLDESSPSSSSSSASAAALRRQGELLSSLPPSQQSPDCQPPAAPPDMSSWRPRKRTLQQEQMSFRFREKIRSQSVLSGEEQCLQMYTGGVTSLAEQITNRIQSQEDVSSSSGCFFCQKRVYLMERLSAEGVFFHRSCFQCFHCSNTLRLAAYAFDQHSGRFYCLQHFDSRLSAPAARKRAAPSEGAPSQRTSIASLVPPPSISSADSVISADRRRSSVVSVMVGTPERIELENYRRSSTKVEGELLEEPEEPEEVSEEILNRFNLSLDEKMNHRSSSESEMEEEEEEEGGGRHHVTSEEARAPWRKTLQLHLRDDQEEEDDDEEDEEDEEEGEVEEEEEEEEEGSEVESSDEGEYSPWDMERHSGLWLLLEEETEDEFPLLSQSVSSAAGSDITHCDTPVGSASSPLPCVTPPTPASETLRTANTPSTASFVTTPSSDSDPAPPTQLSPVVVMETAAQRHAPRQPVEGRGSFDDISPELPQQKPLPLQGRGAEPKEEEEEEGARSRRRHRGAHSLPPRLLFPPMQGGPGALLLQLKGLREAPPTRQVEVEEGGARAMWRAVFSGNRKEKKKKKKKWSQTLPPGAERKDAANQRRATDVRRGLTEESDLESSVLLQRSSLRSRNNLRLELFDLMSEIQRVTIKEEEENQEPAYVPHALAFKRAYAIKRRSLKDKVPIQDSDGSSSCPTEVVGVLVQPKEPSSLSVKETMFERGREEEEALDAKITRRVQRVARRKAKQEQLKRLHKAQMIQRQLQQVEEKQRQLEERGVMVEKALRGEADYWGDTNDDHELELHLEGLGKLDNPALMQQWFQLVQQKNSLIRYESELMIFARELELEDRQSRLQQELRERMAVDDHLKEEWELVEERLILEEMLEVVEQRNSLVSLLEEQRLQERQEDQDLEEVMMTRGLGLSWS
ncbi:protein-methionine sulfoxide oxidase mical3b isoform X2 [Dicentrarchus labrax]|uniref:protein-methionine sulfoxide oxidase mical3b isoform X2 n=1 Tax=Dicentrarchus labrax TaxID=13489 RepID=UPI0021F60907|nr:protein-methionine sulfoxide oxidase mical3b isoform X2 [Dicentrarchus labrax]